MVNYIWERIPENQVVTDIVVYEGDLKITTKERKEYKDYIGDISLPRDLMLFAKNNGFNFLVNSNTGGCDVSTFFKTEKDLKNAKKEYEYDCQVTGIKWRWEATKI